MSLIEKMQNGRPVLTQAKTEDVRADIGKGSRPLAKPGDNVIDLDINGSVPSDLLIIMDNSASAVDRIFVMGGCIPNHLREFNNPDGLEIVGAWENPDNFIMGNDELIRLYLRGMGLAVSAIDRQVTVNPTQFRKPITVVEGEYNNVTQKKITTDLLRLSSMTQDPKINNIVLKKSLFDLVQNKTYFQQVAAGETLSQTFRVQVGLNWNVKVQR